MIRHPDSRGAAAARNTGLAACSTTFVGFVDSDVVLPEAALAACWRIGGSTRRRRGAAHARPRRGGVIAGYEPRHSPLDMGPTGGLSRPAAPSPRSRAPSCSSDGPRSGGVRRGPDDRRGCRLRLAPSTRPADGSVMCPRRSRTTTARLASSSSAATSTRARSGCSPAPSPRAAGRLDHTGGRARLGTRDRRPAQWSAAVVIWSIARTEQRLAKRDTDVPAAGRDADAAWLRPHRHGAEPGRPACLVSPAADGRVPPVPRAGRARGGIRGPDPRGRARDGRRPLDRQRCPASRPRRGRSPRRGRGTDASAPGRSVPSCRRSRQPGATPRSS